MWVEEQRPWHQPPGCEPWLCVALGRSLPFSGSWLFVSEVGGYGTHSWDRRRMKVFRYIVTFNPLLFYR